MTREQIGARSTHTFTTYEMRGAPGASYNSTK
jgi:hypothetical protein